MNDHGLAGRTALVTGASRGIGAAITERFAACGVKVAALDVDDVVTPHLYASSLIRRIRGSVNSREDVRSAIEDATRGSRPLDIVVCNAGFLRYQPFLELDDETWQRHVDVDLTGVFITAQEAARTMTARPTGRRNGSSIIVVTSISAEMPSVSQGHYAAVKAGAQMLAKAMAWELGPYGIRVNSVGPGWVETRLTSDYLAEPNMRTQVEATIPLGRVGQPEDIANAVAFLTSDEAEYITGAHIRIDGGLILGKDKT